MLIVRTANEEDSKDIFAWRNDELTRQMSHKTDVIEWEGHNRWLLATLKNESRSLVMCEEEITLDKVAIVRFDVEDGRALISINISPIKRGAGIAKSCLREAISFFTDSHPGVRVIDAEIKSGNVASRRSFESVGFTFLREETNVLHYEYNV